jgi:multiple sugar transport system permease protein
MHLKPNSGIARTWSRHSFAFLLIAPTVLYLAVFQLYPLLETIRLSFTNTHLVRRTADFVGLRNFSTLFFEDENFWMIVRNTVVFVLVPIVTQFLVAVPAALLLNAKLVGRGLWRGLVMVPWVMPMVVVGLMMKWILDYHFGLVNFSLKSLGLVRESINWFGDERWVFFTLIGASTWKGFAYPTVMTLAGLKGISAELYESAHIDGAGGIGKFWYITLPLLRPVLFVSGIVTLITGWTKFEMVYVLTAGGPGYATSTLPVYIFTNSFSSFRLGLGSAVATVSTVIVLAFSLAYWKLFMNKE